MAEERHYPSIGYNYRKDGSIASIFTFYGFKKIAEFEYDGPKDDIDEGSKKLNEFIEDLKSKFPSRDSFIENVNWDAWSHCQKFADLNEKISYVRRENEFIVEYPDQTFAPGFSIDMNDHSFLKYDLHNCARPDLAIVMYFHGLSALSKVHEAYGISSDYLPTIGFDKSGMQINIPFEVPDKFDNKYLKERIISRLSDIITKKSIFSLDENFDKISVGGIDINVNYKDEKKKAGNFNAHVPIKAGDVLERTTIATTLLHIGTMQSQAMYFYIDNP